MANEITIKQGFALTIAGKPATQLAQAPASELIVIYPGEFSSMKPRLAVKQGETVKRGSPLFTNKKVEGFTFRSPTAGTVEEIVYGARRSLQEIRIRKAGTAEETFPSFTAGDLLSQDREKLLAHLLDTGLFALIKRRPFSDTANPAEKPKSIFINAMNTAPFRVDPEVAVKGNEPAFQAAVNALSRLTDGDVHLCLPAGSSAFSSVQQAKVHSFSGPHPAGNTSTHIHYVDPIAPGDIVWTVNAPDAVQIGKLLLEGRVPDRKIVAAGGPALREAARRHYDIDIGGSLAGILDGNITAEESRVISGDALAGTKIDPAGHVRVTESAITVLAEDRERRFMGWVAPGADMFSASRTFLSRWLKPRDTAWALGTNRRGSLRAMVLTGLYDQYVPLNIMVDYLVRACIAHDTEEAIKLGILETDPEDFALCSVVCPSKTDFSSLVRRTLAEIQKEGL